MLSDTDNDYSHSTEFNVPAQSPHQASAVKADIRLPRLELPTFSGNYLEWIEFRDLFTSMVHSNEAITKSQKLHYLKCALRGEAGSLVQSLQTSDANYDEAWRLLTERYQQERQIIICHISKLFHQPGVNSSDGPTELCALLDNAVKHCRALKALKVPVEHWDHVLVFLISERLDSETRKQWELSIKGTDFPTFEEMRTFLDQRCLALENAGASYSKTPRQKPTNREQHRVRSMTAAITQGCPACEEQHPLFRCERFLSLSVNDKSALVKQHKLCFNCLRSGHLVRECTSTKCKQCHKPHNTLLHYERSLTPTSTSSVPTTNVETVSGHLSNSIAPTIVLLPTAVVKIQGQECRALLDSGSEANFISETLVQRLGLKRVSASVLVNGIGGTQVSRTRGQVQFTLSSRVRDFNLSVSAFVVSRVTGLIPKVAVAVDQRKMSGLQLADPGFNKPSDIDIIIGASHFYQVCLSGKMTDDNNVVAVETVFGWVPCGATPVAHNGEIMAHLSVTDINTTLQRFWEIEEPVNLCHITPEEQQCEEHFKVTHSRDNTGRYVVSLPFREGRPRLGDSKQQAMSRLLSIERRLTRESAEVHQQYSDFMQQYLDLGHMEEITDRDDMTEEHYYIPHHFILRPQSITTKLRVVFDASCTTSTGVSLNETLMVGGKLQEDIFNILLRFRTHKYAVSADIEKMFRQINIHNSEWNYQRILWRASKSESVKSFRLTTVTYGMASSPYIAQRVLQQIAVDEGASSPQAASVILKDFYVDDLMTGADDIVECQQLCSDVYQMLKKGGFELRKWSTNEPQVLASIPEQLVRAQSSLHIHEDSLVGTLGLKWDTIHDRLLFHECAFPEAAVSKRSILSDVAKLYDPLGWLAPVTIAAKIILQKLWVCGVDWDSEVPYNVRREWIELRTGFSCLGQLSVPRFIVNKSQQVQVHGFCDASEKAYGACIYIRQTSNQGPEVNLLCAKTRVAPVKTVSIPRLELCAMVLLAKLLERTMEILQMGYDHVTAWSDSSVALAWLQKHPSHWKPFVANRVSSIQTILPPSHWRHVPTENNPADYASRGLLPDVLMTKQMWWHGPSFLQQDEAQWPQACKLIEETTLEQKSNRVTVYTAEQEELWIFNRYSSWTSLQRVTALCQRFVRNLKVRAHERIKGFLQPEELDRATMFLVSIVQKSEFKDLQCAIKEGRTKHAFLSLSPFIDRDNLVRVGGRLCHSSVGYDQKHPMLLPRNHVLTRLIIEYYHHKLLHPGTSLLLATLRQKFWVPGGQATVKSVTSKCLSCFRNKSVKTQQYMGDLPSNRTTPLRPFLVTGVDFGGPFLIKAANGRGGKVWKAYLALFVCHATKAVHLEVVGDLSTDAFLACLRRFISRRGVCREINSDNGTNFIGANNRLKELRTLFNSEQHKNKLGQFLSKEGIEWKFIPPRSPHFGGLWEAGIKSAKSHLHRVVGDRTLTFEELNTLFIQIEACLNSRPLSALSNDPNDLGALTPAHFIIGEPFGTVPEPDITEKSTNRLARWQLIQQATQHFWRRWSAEYLTQLQRRVKWQKKFCNIEVNDLVLVKEDHVPPLQWSMGRVLKVYPGEDQIVRVAAVKTNRGEFKRPVVKLIKLPVEN